MDDQAMVREGVRSLVEGVPEWAMCGETWNGADALRIAAETQPDIIILDISMPNVSGIDLLVELGRTQPKAELLVLTLQDSERIVVQALRAGARGYLLKSDAGEKLIDAVAALSLHETYFSPAISEILLQSYLDSDFGHAGGAEQAARAAGREADGKAE